MSNEKPFDAIEALIRKAAEESRPDFDGAAWTKMNALLDEKDKRRRPIAWWITGILLLIGGAGTFYHFNLRTASTKPTVIQTTVLSESAAQNTPGAQQAVTDADATKKASQEATITAPTATTVNGKDERVSMSGTDAILLTRETARSSKPTATTTILLPVGEPKQSSTLTNASNYRTRNRKKLLSKKQVQVNVAEPAPSTNDDVNESVLAGKEKTTSTDSHLSDGPILPVIDSLANLQKETVSKIQEDKKITPLGNDSSFTSTTKKRSSRKGFYLVAMMGADMGNVRLLSFNNTKLVPRYGAAIGYRLNDRWSVQTGLFISNKRYNAGPGDYHPKEDSYWYGVDIRKVEAACMIYEIPVTVRYDAINKSSHRFYLALSASSYIMKRENYHYHYYRYTQYYQKYWQYTGNKHFLSTLSLGVGLDKSISSRLSVLAEPSISLPLSGVGDGNVKLFSAGIEAGLRWNVQK